MSFNVNSLNLAGRIVKNIELQKSQNGTVFTRVGIATDGRKRKNGETQTNFIYVTVFGQSASYLAQYARKGTTIWLEGRLEQNVWTDQQTGQQRSRLEVLSNNVQIVHNAQGVQQPQVAPQQFNQAPVQQAYTQPQAAPQQFNQAPVQQAYTQGQAPVQPQTMEQTTVNSTDVPF
ncbi:single-stranded DNA-binding protein [Ligilactobacillus equi]|uniref:Single-stranded DNA-binding protein n=1 Tax=Ligilactobacillus equi DPC 6820 TaxID=1392007 RepID=V7HZB1_9LACO|nr:single-stranded DNA-binding protein [Ligilactobacillus equi]ETA74543.1 single-strand binding protein [Ligilactobacillus equi DPC 6820]